MLFRSAGALQISRHHVLQCTGEGKGCAIYKDRPEVCRHYECAWLQGMFEENQRPDKNGFVIEMQESAVGWCWVVHEYWPGMFEKHAKGTQALEYIRRTRFPMVVCFHGGGRKLFTTDPAILQKIEELGLDVTLERNHG